jgi:hypothetical protein
MKRLQLWGSHCVVPRWPCERREGANNCLKRVRERKALRQKHTTALRKGGYGGKGYTAKEVTLVPSKQPAKLLQAMMHNLASPPKSIK